MSKRAHNVGSKTTDNKKNTQNASANADEPRASEGVDKVEVATLAYRYWEERGRPPDSDQQDWFKAEKDLKKDRNS